MTLSLLCCAHGPAEQVAAALAPLRHAVDEVVVCDTRDAPDDAYARLADRVVRLDAPGDDGVGAWPYDACSHEWVLRIDDDEVASATVIDALAGLTVPGPRRQVWLPTRTLLRDGSGWLHRAPHWPGYVARLLRNDGTTRFAGPPPGQPVHALPATYADAPVYRLAAEATAVPGHTSPVDERDAAAVSALVAAAGAITPRRSAAPELGPDAYAARIELVEDEVRADPGTSHTIHLRVTNDGDARWPWGLAQHPLIRVGYRLRDRAAMLLWEGPRSALVEDVPPGASTIVPVRIDVPARPGEYELQLDLVHEGVRWFDCAIRPWLVVGDVTPTRRPEGTAPVADAHEASVRYDLPPRPPGVPLRPYLICSTPRSGSTLLSRALTSSRVAGVATEYLNPSYREDMQSGWGVGTKVEPYLAAAIERRTTPNGVFALKAHWEQVAQVGEELGLAPDEPIAERIVPGARYVRVIRRDLDAQTVSYWVALRSGQWRKALGAGSGANLPPYRYPELAECRRHIESSELGWERYLRIHGITAHTIVYEELADRYEETVRGVLTFLGIDDDAAIAPPDLQVQRDARSAEILERYRTDRAALSP